MEPLLSIIIANYNYGRFLEAAIQSVLDQNVPEVELIVVDGGSTDNSVDIIRKHADKIFWWVSESDRGQSDAFNKGFAHARGKYLTWLNADDMMVTGCLARVVSAMKKHPDCEWFTANFYRIDKAGNRTESFWGPHCYPFVLQRKNSPIVAYGPATFFTKKIFDDVGGMNVSCHYTMDTDLWVRFIVAGIKQRRINCFCWAFRMHEASKTAEYGDHSMPAGQFQKMCEEERADYRRAGYQPSNLLKFLMKLWRVVDGSYFLSIIQRKKSIKTVKEV